MNKSSLLIATAAFTVATSAAGVAQWNQLSPATVPSDRVAPAMGYDAARQNVVMFGGAAGFGFSTETWTYDGYDWTQVAIGAGPAGRSDAGFVYDSARTRMVLYGGNAGGGPFGGPSNDETWAWDGQTWTQLQPTNTPGGLALHGMAYDPLRDRVVVYGGLDNNAFPIAKNETWEFDGTNWTQAMPSVDPGPREHPAMCWDPVNGRVLLFGGIDPQIGGFSDTWSYDGTNWTRLTTMGAPAPRSRAEMVFDTARGVAVLQGGTDPMNGNVFDETWEFDGTNWTLVASGMDVPADHQQFSMAYDARRGNIVLFGGADSFFGSYDETWEHGASFHRFGAGCSGPNAAPTISNATGPVQGGTFQLDIGGLDPASSVAYVVLGFVPGTIDLGTIGMTGCTVYATSYEIVGVPAAAGMASLSLPVPADPALYGSSFVCQALAPDAGANSVGLVLSQGGEALIGR